MRTEQNDGESINTLTPQDVASIRALGPAGFFATNFTTEPDGSMVIRHPVSGPGASNQRKLLSLAQQAGVLEEQAR